MSIIPYVIEERGYGERSCDIFSRLLSDRIVFLGEEVTDAAASSIIGQMLFLEAQDPERDIQLYINMKKQRNMIRRTCRNMVLPLFQRVERQKVFC